MNLNKNMYFSSSIKLRRQKKIIKKINKGRHMRSLYLLISRLLNSNLIEIVNCKELYRLDRNEMDISLHGITDSKEDAVDFLTKTVRSTMEHYHTIDKNTLLMELERDEKDII